MRKLLLVMVLAAVAAALGCRRAAEPSTAAVSEDGEPMESKEGTKHAWIYFTNNHDKGGDSPYNTDCVATVVAERIGAQMGSTKAAGTKIIWHLRLSNGVNDDDRCPTLDTSKVYLEFATDVMGSAAGKKLKAMGMKIEGTVSSSKSDIGAIIDHKYQVKYDDGTPMGMAAGPDPVVVVGCSSCGEPPEK